MKFRIGDIVKISSNHNRSERHDTCPACLGVKPGKEYVVIGVDPDWPMPYQIYVNGILTCFKENELELSNGDQAQV